MFLKSRGVLIKRLAFAHLGLRASENLHKRRSRNLRSSRSGDTESGQTGRRPRHRSRLRSALASDGRGGVGGGLRMEGGPSGAGGESKGPDAGGVGWTGTGLRVNSGVGETGAADTTWT